MCRPSVVPQDSSEADGAINIIHTTSQPRLDSISSSSSSSDISSDSEVDVEIVKIQDLPKRREPLFLVAPDYKPKMPEEIGPDVDKSLLGKITNCRDGCIVIQSNPSAPVLDTGSALFLENGKPLGEIYETFGPVRGPFYVVVLPNSPCLLASIEQAQNHKRRPKQPSLNQIDIIQIDLNNPTADDTVATVKLDLPGVDLDQGSPVIKPNTPTYIPDIKIGDSVFYVPENPELTSTVFYSQLVQTKGSDASWVEDKEPPPDELDFSDDEQERLHKRTLRMKRRKPERELLESTNSPNPNPNSRSLRPTPNSYRSRLPVSSRIRDSNPHSIDRSKSTNHPMSNGVSLPDSYSHYQASVSNPTTYRQAAYAAGPIGYGQVRWASPSNPVSISPAAWIQDFSHPPPLSKPHFTAVSGSPALQAPLPSLPPPAPPPTIPNGYSLYQAAPASPNHLMGPSSQPFGPTPKPVTTEVMATAVALASAALQSIHQSLLGETNTITSSSNYIPQHKVIPPAPDRQPDYNPAFFSQPPQSYFYPTTVPNSGCPLIPSYSTAQLPTHSIANSRTTTWHPT